MPRSEIVVVGAGIAGASTALSLRKRGAAGQGPANPIHDAKVGEWVRTRVVTR